MLKCIRMVFRCLVKRSVMFLIATRCQANLSKEQYEEARELCVPMCAYRVIYVCVYIKVKMMREGMIKSWIFKGI